MWNGAPAFLPLNLSGDEHNADQAANIDLSRNVKIAGKRVKFASQ